MNFKKVFNSVNHIAQGDSPIKADDTGYVAIPIPVDMTAGIRICSAGSEGIQMIVGTKDPGDKFNGVLRIEEEGENVRIITFCNGTEDWDSAQVLSSEAPLEDIADVVSITGELEELFQIGTALQALMLSALLFD